MVRTPSSEGKKMAVISALKTYGLAFSIMFMLFGILLLPSSHIFVHQKGLISELGTGIEADALTPFVNNEFIFYWSPIDPLYDQADNEQNCPWGIWNGYNNDDNNGQTDGEDRCGITYYGDSYQSDEGAISIGSYDDDNEVTITLLNGHVFNQVFKDEYPENMIRSFEMDENGDYCVFNVDENDNGIADGDCPAKVNLMDPARAPISPDLQKVTDYELWSGKLDRYEGKILYTTKDLWMWDGMVKVSSTGRVTVDQMLTTDAFIDKNCNGIPDLEDDCEEGDGEGDDEIAQGINTAWFANSLSDDAMWSFYGDEFFGFVNRDLMIASYDDDNTIRIVDRSDGDDSKTITLDAWENYVCASTFVQDAWCGGDDNGDSYELDNNCGNFQPLYLFSLPFAMKKDLLDKSGDPGTTIRDFLALSGIGLTSDATLHQEYNGRWWIEDGVCKWRIDESGGELKVHEYIVWDDANSAKRAMASDYVSRAIDSGNFEGDWVLVRSEKPVTIYGGLWDNNLHTQAYGFLGSRYYVPFSAGLTITGLEKEAHIDIDFDDETVDDCKFTLLPNQQYTYKSMTACPFSYNYVADIAWAKIISDSPIRVELWEANDDNAFDFTMFSSFRKGFDYYPAQEKWSAAIHHRCILYIAALEDDTHVGWTGTWLDNQPASATLDKYEIYRIVVDSDEDYNGDCEDDTEPDNEDELETVMQMVSVNANKNVMLFVNYARDYSCCPQGSDIILSTKPTIQRSQGGGTFWPMPIFLSALLAVDALAVIAGTKGLVGTLSYNGNNRSFRLFKGKK